jgi:hypothetical protein
MLAREDHNEFILTLKNIIDGIKVMVPMPTD